MPKGGLLHAHLDGMVDSSFLLSLALNYPNIHVRIKSELTASNLASVLPEFRGLSTTEANQLAEPTASLTGAKARIGQWVNIQTARKNFSSALGGPQGFDAWVIGGLTINPAEAYGTHNTVDKVSHLVYSVSFQSNTNLS